MPQHWRSQDGIVHCESINAGDYFLCGVAPEGERGDEAASETHAAINCKDCIAVIEFCQRVRRGEWAATKREQR